MIILLIINILWFGGGFLFFSINSAHAAKAIRPDIPYNDDRSFLAIQALPFLGGMNLAFMSGSLYALYHLIVNSNNSHLEIVFFIAALAHGTQFFFNIPHTIKGGLEKGAPWDVLKGRMLFIFVMDFLTMVINIVGFFNIAKF